MVSDLRKRAWRYCVLASFLVSANASATVMLSIDVDPSEPGVQSRLSATVGQSIEVDVVISGVDPLLLPVTAFDLAVSFDPEVLEATGVTSGGYLGVVTGGFPGSNPFEVIRQLGADSVRYGETYVGIPPTPSVDVLFTMTFAVLRQGSAVVDFVDSPNLGLSGINLSTAFPQFVAFQPQSATLTTSTATVPTPPVGLLLLSGMLMLCRARKPQRSRA